MTTARPLEFPPSLQAPGTADQRFDREQVEATDSGRQQRKRQIGFGQASDEKLGQAFLVFAFVGIHPGDGRCPPVPAENIHMKTPGPP